MTLTLICVLSELGNDDYITSRITRKHGYTIPEEGDFHVLPSGSSGST